ncbi:MAG: hypothetical protein K0R47_2135 [Brevibacillus sp.]|nr:hypothetical protein [Brevibacillus sp.]
MGFNVEQVPFSRYGSFMVISWLPGNGRRREGLYLRSVRGGDNDIGAVFRIELIYSGRSVPFETNATPTKVRLDGEEGFVEFCMPDPKVLRVRGEGAGLRLTLQNGPYDYAIPAGDSNWEVNSFAREVRFKLVPLAGTLAMDAPWEGTKCGHVVADFFPDPESGKMEGAVEEYVTVCPQREYDCDFATAHNRVKGGYQTWLAQTLSVPEPYMEARELAAYITWSCVVEAEGYLPRPAMYMSKNWMTNVWSWDHCFNAMALIKDNPRLAWDQFLLFFDRQDGSGTLPDFMNDRHALWNCCKPPIHGWTLKWMRKRSDAIGEEQLREVYEPLARWTMWWFRHRDDDGDGIPQYNHGNDSGWDNSTAFHAGVPLESPDLCAYLIIQLDELADIAGSLGKPEEAIQWQAMADATLEKMMEHFWTGERFVARRSGSHDPVEADTLLMFMPILLGKRLPQGIRNRLINGLKEEGRFLTNNGLATENVASPFYVSDGYWRGPIWAPSTMLLADGLLVSGEPAFAAELARRFCSMAAANGMAENFDAQSGRGLRDRAFTWTSSVFLILAHEYLNLSK